MTLPVITIVIVIGMSMMAVSLADFNFPGVKCGQNECDISEYCSTFDTHCRPCTVVCDPTSHNYQPQECMKECQVYIYDQRYVRRIDPKQYDDLKEQVERLRVCWMITITLASFLLLAVVYLFGKNFIQFQKIRDTLRAACRKNLKRAANKNRVQSDVEAGANKQNGLKLTIPSISATVEPKIIENGNSGSNSNEISTTPNTTSTPLSRRCASEDTTLDYAYDNPAMTPSPEAAQLRTKARESSF